MISRKLNSLALLGSLLSGIIVSHASASELKMISQIQVPGEPLDAFDISFVDQKTGYYYLADRSNNAVDMVDGKTLKVSAQVRGFLGAISASTGVACAGAVPSKTKASRTQSGERRKRLEPAEGSMLFKISFMTKNQ